MMIIPSLLFILIFILNEVHTQQQRTICFHTNDACERGVEVTDISNHVNNSKLSHNLVFLLRWPYMTMLIIVRSSLVTNLKYCFLINLPTEMGNPCQSSKKDLR